MCKMISVPNLAQLQIYQDGALLSDIENSSSNDLIAGFTTNPTLMASAGITDYELSAKQMLQACKGKPISLEVFSDDFDEMEYQAKILAGYGTNVFVKIPIINTEGRSSTNLIKRLTSTGIKVNITAIFTIEQFKSACVAIQNDVDSILSVFAGRIADTGRDPMPVMRECVVSASSRSNVKVLWASPREVLNVYQASDVGCHIITATPELISKLKLFNKDLNEYSRETVEMFYLDAQKQKFDL